MRWHEIVGESNQPIDPAKRAKAVATLNKSLASSRKAEQAATDVDEPALAGAKRAEARARANTARAKFRAATQPTTDG